MPILMHNNSDNAAMCNKIHQFNVSHLRQVTIGLMWKWKQNIVMQYEEVSFK